MKLNADLGESFGHYRLGMDSELMPHLDEANIACGFHAGDPLVIRHTLQLAKRHGVTVGAHPSYPDLQGFGRRSMALSVGELTAMLLYQIAALDGMASSEGLCMAYVKPHGALYNDMMRDSGIRRSVMAATAAYHRPLALVIQATPDFPQHQQIAAEFGVELRFEAFADRAYTAEGRLVPRSQPGAVLGCDAMLKQAQQLHRQGTVTTIDGSVLRIHADTLCVHGDNAEAIAAIASLRTLLDHG
jgi:5-oxoprolinase (ATP-hydrolysing) subunit A